MQPSSPLGNRSHGYSSAQSTAASVKSLTVQIIASPDADDPNNRGKPPNFQFDISMADLIRREEEMKETAQQFQIPASRWRASRLFQESKYRNNYRSNNSSNKSSSTSKNSNNRIVVTVDPQQDGLLQNYSHTLMEWRPWLSRLLQDYYQTGQLRVPDEAQGSDLLLALEYFGILYAPGQLLFQSHAAYQRVRCWSDYLTHRTHLADWIADQVQQQQSAQQRRRKMIGKKNNNADDEDDVIFFGTLSQANQSIRVGGENTGIRIRPWYNGDGDGDDRDAACQLAYRLFNNSADNLVAHDLRNDFCVYLQNLFVGDEVQVTFATKVVHVITRNNAGKPRKPVPQPRAILRIEFATNNTTTIPQEAPRKSKWRNNNSQDSPTNVAQDIYNYDDSDKNNKPSNSFWNDADFYRIGGGNGPRVAGAINPVFEASVAGWEAPFDVIDPERNECQTVISGLTGNNFRDMDSLGEDTRAQALRHEWLQGSLLNKDIGKNMRELLEVPEEDGKEDEKDDGGDGKQGRNLLKRIPSFKRHQNKKPVEGASQPPLGGFKYNIYDPTQQHPPPSGLIGDDETFKSAVFPEQYSSDTCGWDWINNVCQQEGLIPMEQVCYVESFPCETVFVPEAGGGASQAVSEMEPVPSYFDPEKEKQDQKSLTSQYQPVVQGQTPTESSKSIATPVAKHRVASPSAVPNNGEQANLVKDRLSAMQNLQMEQEEKQRQRQQKRFTQQQQQQQTMTEQGQRQRATQRQQQRIKQQETQTKVKQLQDTKQPPTKPKQEAKKQQSAKDPPSSVSQRSKSAKDPKSSSGRKSNPQQSMASPTERNYNHHPRPKTGSVPVSRGGGKSSDIVVLTEAPAKKEAVKNNESGFRGLFRRKGKQ